MKRIAGSDYLFERDGKFYFRAAVPKDVQKAFGRKEYKVSLQTGDLREAKYRCAEKTVLFRRTCDQLRNPRQASMSSAIIGEPTSDDLKQLVRDWFFEVQGRENSQRRKQFPAYVSKRGEMRADAKTRLNHLEWAFDEGIIPEHTKWLADEILEMNGLKLDAVWVREFQDFVLRGQLEFARREIDELSARSRARPHDEALFDRPDNDSEIHLKGSETPALQTVIQRFALDPTRNRSSSTQRKYESELALIETWFGGATPIGTIQREKCTEFRDQILLRLPSNWKKRHKDLTPQDVADRFPAAPGEGMRRKTINGYLIRLTSLFTFAVNEGYIERNPAMNLRLAEIELGDGRSPFSIADLNKIFAAPIYTGCLDDERGYSTKGTNQPKRGRFWVPLLALYNGLRLEEACQLHASDIEVIETIPSIRIVADLEAEVDDVRSLKSRASQRTIPVPTKNSIRAGVGGIAA